MKTLCQTLEVRYGRVLPERPHRTSIPRQLPAPLAIDWEAELRRVDREISLLCVVRRQIARKAAG